MRRIAILLFLLITPTIQAQEPTLDETKTWLVETLNSAAGFATSEFKHSLDSASFDGCTLTYKYTITREANGRAMAEVSALFTVALVDLDSVKATRDGNHAFVALATHKGRPKIKTEGLTRMAGENHDIAATTPNTKIGFADALLAERVANALNRAVELCRKQ